MPLVHTIKMTKQGFEAMPAEERRLVFLFAHAANEITVMNRVLLAASQSGKATGRELSDVVHSGQTLVIIRDLVAKLCEARLLYEKCYQKNKQLRIKYHDRIDSHLRRSMKQLVKTFNDGRLMRVRNRFSAHYTDDDDCFQKAFEVMPSDEMWYYYLSKFDGNSFYFASEAIVRYAILLEISPLMLGQDILVWYDTTFKAFIRLVMKAAQQILTVFGHLIAFVIESNFPHLNRTEERVLGQNIVDLRLPFFTEDDTDVGFQPYHGPGNWK